MALPIIAAAGVVVGAAGVSMAAASAPAFALFLVEESLQAVSIGNFFLIQARQYKGLRENNAIYKNIIEKYREAINIIGAVYKLDPTGLLFGVFVFPHTQFLKASMANAAAVDRIISLHTGTARPEYFAELEALKQATDAQHAQIALDKSLALSTIKANQAKRAANIKEDFNDEVLGFLDARNDSLIEIDKIIADGLAPLREENKLFKSEIRKKFNDKELTREEFLAQTTAADRVLIQQVAAVKADRNQEKDAIKSNYTITVREFTEKKLRKTRKLQDDYNNAWIAIQVDEKMKKRVLDREFDKQKADLEQRHFPETGEEKEVTVLPPIEAIPLPEPEKIEEAEKFDKETEKKTEDFSSEGHAGAKTNPSGAGVDAVLKGLKLNKAVRAAAKAVIKVAPSVAKFVLGSAVKSTAKVLSTITSIKNAASRTISKIFRKSGKKK